MTSASHDMTGQVVSAAQVALQVSTQPHESSRTTADVLFAVGFFAVGLVLLAWFIAVVTGILRSSLSAGMKVLWVLFAIWVPVLGWLAWMVIGSPDARKRATQLPA
jgi:hypothetical protein